MTIKEAEERTGLTRSNIRFYEKEKLIIPSRNRNNGYRDYSQKNIEDIKKVAYLRTLGISIEIIRNIIEETVTLREVMVQQHRFLKVQIHDLNKAKAMCEIMIDENISYDNLVVEKYVNKLQSYWNNNHSTFKLDAVSFLYIWGSFITWAIITALCLIIAVISYWKLPLEIPIQWNNASATSTVNKSFIFVYPLACVVIRFFLRKCIHAKLQVNILFSALITEYLSNYMCFLALTVEISTILFIYGLIKSIQTILFINTAVLITLLIVGITK